MKEIERINEIRSREMKVVRCKSCDAYQEFYLDGKFENGRKRWVDIDNKLCNGRLCADCNRKRAKVTMRKTREDRITTEVLGNA